MRAVREQLWLPPNVTDHCYDPFVAELSEEPEAADFVICTDVMEHVEPQCTAAVLDHIAALTKVLVLFSISFREANKVLADWRNAHINLRPPEYWLREIKKRFIVSEARVHGDEVIMLIAQSIEAVKLKLRSLKNERRIAA